MSVVDYDDAVNVYACSVCHLVMVFQREIILKKQMIERGEMTETMMTSIVKILFK